MIISQYENLVLESYSNGFVLLESDSITDYNKILCDEKGNIYNVLNFQKIENEEVFVLSDQITLHKKNYLPFIKLDKTILPGNILFVVHQTSLE